MVHYKTSISPQICETHLKGGSHPHYSAPAYNQYMLHGRGLGRIAKHLIPFLRTTVWPTMKETLAPIGKQFVNDIESGVPAKSAFKRSYTDLKGVIKRKLVGRGGGSRPIKRRKKTTKEKSKKKKKKATIKKKKVPKRKKKIIRKKTDFFAEI
jgi:hypothetical protein